MKAIKWISGVTASTALALVLVGCGGSSSIRQYTVSVPLTESENGMTALLVDYDSGQPVDSTIVEEGGAIFSGLVDAPTLVRVIVDGDRLGQMILEPGDILFSRAIRSATGSPLNERLNRLSEEESKILTAMRALDESDSLYVDKAGVLEARYDSLNRSTFLNNTDNPIGYMAFIDRAYEWSLDTLDAKLKQYPQFASSKRLANLRRSLELKKTTSPGNPYKDFVVEYNGISQKLSDYIGNGKYTLVDFWASWCRPCIQETKTIKNLYSVFGPEGSGQLNVVGVGVWDEPQNTLKAIEENELPWPSILNAQSIPTDIYGIPAIPCIILIGPDGTILSRDKQGQELIEEVTSIINGEKTKA